MRCTDARVAVSGRDGGGPGRFARSLRCHRATALLATMLLGGILPAAAMAQTTPTRPIAKPGAVTKPTVRTATGAGTAAPATTRATAGKTPVAAAPATSPSRSGTTAAAPAANAESLQIMAVVNGEQITRQTLAKECLRRFGKEILETMVNKQIIFQACKQRGVSITEKEVDEEINQIAKKFGLSVDRWLELLETERDVDPRQYRTDIIWPMLALRKLAAKQVTVTQEDLQQAFESEYGPKVKARLISVSSQQKADQLQALAQANPDNFPQLAKEHSEDKATASAYGVIPPIRKHMGDPNLEQIAFSLKESQISPVIQVGNQYLILKCEQQIPQTYISAENLREIEAQLQVRITDHKMRTESANVFQQLQSQAEVVNTLNDPRLQQQYPGVAALVNGQQITLLQLSEECVKRWGGEVLEGEVNRKLLVQELKRRNITVEEADIDAEVRRAAETYGYTKPDGSADVDAWLKQITGDSQTTIELYVRDAVWPSVALKKLVDGKVTVTQDDLKKGFESNYGPRVEVLAIVLGNQRQAQTVWDMARGNPTDEFFGNLANQYSIEPTSRANFGKVPPVRKHGGQPAVEDEAFKLKPGELSGIIAVGDQFLIMRCLGQTKPVVADLKDVQDELARDIEEKKLRIAMAAEFERLRDVAQIDNFLAGTTQSAKRLVSGSKLQTASPAGFEQPATPRAGSVKR